ncbi:Predicted transcriptional regulator [Lysinibacillus sphaericus]|nr:Predicted transcriptional regulator [Lysinibacillus sphaericus]
MRYWLKELRNSKKLTQQSVADRSDIERSYYTMIESGKRTPSVQVAKSIALVIGFDWTIFFENQCNETKQKEVV